jgi:hypothetical protein
LTLATECGNVNELTSLIGSRFPAIRLVKPDVREQPIAALAEQTTLKLTP